MTCLVLLLYLWSNEVVISIRGPDCYIYTDLDSRGYVANQLCALMYDAVRDCFRPADGSGK
jgi:hypothetical protein